MEIMQAISINGTSFPVHNETEYYLDDFIYSTYGFEIYYRNRRGIKNIHWRNTLKEYEFGTPVMLYRGLYQAETRVQTLNFRDFMARPFVLHWTFGDEWYGLGFDGNEFWMQTNHNNVFLPDSIL